MSLINWRQVGLILDLSPENELLMVAQAQEGCVEAFEQLFSWYYDMVYSVAFRLCFSHHDAEDITQDTFVKAARHIVQYKREAKFKTWLYRIASNAAVDMRRKAVNRNMQIQAHETEILLATDRLDEAQDAVSHRVVTALASLPDNQRHAIVLTVYEGMTHSEVAEILECPEGTVSWYIYEAKKTLSRKLAEDRANG